MFWAFRYNRDWSFSHVAYMWFAAVFLLALAAFSGAVEFFKACRLPTNIRLLLGSVCVCVVMV